MEISNTIVIYVVKGGTYFCTLTFISLERTTFVVHWRHDANHDEESVGFGSK
jgi:hypothetical protein